MKQFLLTLWQRPKWQFVLFYGIGLIYIFFINPSYVSYHHVPEAVVAELKFSSYDIRHKGYFKAPHDTDRIFHFDCELLAVPNCPSDSKPTGFVLLEDFYYAVYEHQCEMNYCPTKLLSATVIEESGNEFYYQAPAQAVEKDLRFDRIYRPLLVLYFTLAIIYLLSSIRKHFEKKT